MDHYRDGAVWEQLAGYARATRVGTRIAVSGTTAAGPDGAALHPGDTHAQTREALHRALAGVAALGGSPADVLRSRVYLVPEADWRAAAEAHREVLGEVAPATTMLFVAALIAPGLLVEVELEAQLTSS